MMKAIVLNAGQGSRLLPWTKDRPKCLVPVGGVPILAIQLEALAQAGVEEVVQVIGFGARQVRRTLRSLALGSLRVRAVENPYYRQSDNLISCWLARKEMDRDFVLLNGDTLFESEVLLRLLASPAAPVTLAVSHKSSYDDDDMKVHYSDGRLLAVAKTLPPELTDAESIGMVLFRGPGPRLFRETLDRAVRREGASRRWYLSVIDEMAKEGLVSVAGVDGLEWTEVDFPEDLERARALVRRWRARDERQMLAV